MAALSTTQPYYFSSNHLAADLLYNVAGFTFFCALGGAIYPELYSIYLTMLATVASYDSTVLAIFAVGAYIVIGSVSGLISSRLVLALRDLVPGLQDKIGYRHLYKTKHRKVADIYASCLGRDQLYTDEGLTSSDMRNRLMFLLGRVNQMGYSHVYRAYSIVALFRQAILYSVVLVSLSWWFSPRIPVLPVAVGLLLFGWAGLKFAIAYAASTEFDFIVVTSYLMGGPDNEIASPVEGASDTATEPLALRGRRR